MTVSRKFLKIIGLMSGTSLDGIDASLVKTNGVQLERTKYFGIFKYDNITLSQLEKAVNKEIFDQNIPLIKELNDSISYQHFLAVKKILQDCPLKPDLIGYHGHTLYHNPKERISLQLGNRQLLSNLLNIPVVSDFRQNDIDYGGEGAPLAPIYHKLLIENLNLKLPSAIINIGGIANISIWNGKDLISFDTGPGNSLLNYYSKKLFNKEYDHNGAIASQGNINNNLLDNFLKHNYFSKEYPKSAERSIFLNHMHKIFYKKKISNFDLMTTLTEITAKSIQLGVNKQSQKLKTIILIGGGVYNTFLFSRLKEFFGDILFKGEDIGLNSSMIEAELIAFLTARHLNKMPITFPSTTGVTKPKSGGVIYNPS